MEIEVYQERPVVEIIIEESFVESAKKYYELTKSFFDQSGPNPFMNLKLIDKGSQNGIPNTAPGLEVMDVVRGFFDADTYWKAALYLGGAPSLRSSWQPIGEDVFSSSIPSVPVAVLPVVPGTPNYSSNYSPTHYKIYN
jgi:hypothetical protein